MPENTFLSNYVYKKNRAFYGPEKIDTSSSCFDRIISVRKFTGNHPIEAENVHHWIAYANYNPHDAKLAIDGRPDTRWTTKQSMKPRMSFQIILGEHPIPIEKLTKEMFVTNYLGLVLLTHLLLDTLKTSALAWIITVTAPSSAKIDFNQRGSHPSCSRLTDGSSALPILARFLNPLSGKVPDRRAQPFPKFPGQLQRLHRK
jgi:hypothetical protein